MQPTMLVAESADESDESASEEDTPIPKIKKTTRVAAHQNVTRTTTGKRVLEEKSGEDKSKKKRLEI